MSTALSGRLKQFEISPTTVVFAAVAELRRNGADVASLVVGEPDFPTPDNISAAGIRAIRNGETRYTPGAGLYELREAIARKLWRENGLDYTPEEIVVSVGAKQAILASILAVADEDSEVIIPAPCYVSYPDMVKLAGAQPVIVGKKPDYTLDIEAIRSAVTERTRAVIICSPNNPTGAVYDEESLRALAALAVEKDFFVITDEIYEKTIYDDTAHFSIGTVPGMKERTILINGVSKTYAMTGWRLGYAAARRDTVQAIVKLESQMTTCVSAFVQRAAIEALDGPQDSVLPMVEEFRRRRDYIAARLQAIPGVSCPPIRGAFYAFFDVQAYLSDGKDSSLPADDAALAEFLLREHHVAVMPGSAYFAPGHIRISYASSLAQLEEAMDRLEAGLLALRKRS